MRQQYELPEELPDQLFTLLMQATREQLGALPIILTRKEIATNESFRYRLQLRPCGGLPVGATVALPGL